MGGGGEGSSGAKNAAQAQAKIVRDLFQSTAKGRQAGLSNNLNVLRTGGRGGVIPPVLQSLISGADTGTKTTIDSTVDASNKAGISNSFTKGLTNTLSSKGGMTREAARGGYVKEAIGKSPELSVQPIQLATQGLQGLVRRGAAEDIAKGQRDAQIEAGAGAAAGAIAAAVIGALVAASRADIKDEIEYLDTTERDAIGECIDDLKITTWTYKGEEHTRLGVIIEDVEAEGVPYILTQDTNAVDLYSLLSMTIAKVQTLERRLSALENSHA